MRTMTRNAGLICPLTVAAGIALIGVAPCAMAGTIGLSFQTTSVGTQSSGSTVGGVAITGAATIVPSGASASYIYGDTFTSPTPLITGSSYGFFDDYAFTVSTSTADSVTTTINLGNLQQISNLSVGLFSTSAYNLFAAGGAPSLTPIPGEVNATTSGSTATLSVADLSAGTYVLEIRGQATGVNGGSYAGVLNVAPVPLPATLPLLGLGLGLLFTRRGVAALMA